MKGHASHTASTGGVIGDTVILDLPIENRFYISDGNSFVIPQFPGRRRSSLSQMKSPDAPVQELDEEMANGSDKTEESFNAIRPKTLLSNTEPTLPPRPKPFPVQLEHPLRGHAQPAASLSSSRQLAFGLADICQTVFQNLLQVAPPRVLDPSREQVSSLTVSLPTPSCTSIFNSMKCVNYISANMEMFLNDSLPQSGTSSVQSPVNDFDIGELLQSTGDVLSGLVAVAGVEMILFHGEAEIKQSWVRADEVGISFALTHILQQVLRTCHANDTMEIGLFLSGQPTDESAHCKISISHKWSTSSAQVDRNWPDFSISFLPLLLAKVGVTRESKPLSTEGDMYRHPFEVSFTVQRVPPPQITPTHTHPGDYTDTSVEDLSSFADDLRGYKGTLYASAKRLFPQHLTTYLIAWGMHIGHVLDAVEQIPPKTELPEAPKETSPSSHKPSFIFIDDDIDVLRDCVQQEPPLASSTSRNIVIHFTSLSNFMIVKDLLSSVTAGPHSPEVVVLPKPVGPRRVLTALHTAITKPSDDSFFSPLAPSPVGRTPTSIPSSPAVATRRPSISHSGSERSSGSNRDIITPPIVSSPSTDESSPVSPPVKLKSSIRLGKSPSSGVVMQSPDGEAQGLYFCVDRGSKSRAARPKPPLRVPSSQSDNRSPQPKGTTPDGSYFPANTRRSLDLARKVSMPSSPTPSLTTKEQKRIPPHLAPPPISVLIVEDNLINQTILSTSMKRNKIKCATASNGKAAVEKWKTGQYHLIIMDIQMPVMDGIEATKIIRKAEKERERGKMAVAATPGEHVERPNSSGVIILALTASSQDSDRQTALAAGCNDFLTKPINLRWLDNKIAEWGSMQALQMYTSPDDFRVGSEEYQRALEAQQAALTSTISKSLRLPERRGKTPPPSRPTRMLEKSLGHHPLSTLSSTVSSNSRSPSNGPPPKVRSSTADSTLTDNTDTSRDSEVIDRWSNSSPPQSPHP